MPKYQITCDVRSARGTQWFTVEADSPAEAIYKHQVGESDFGGEEIEVTELCDPTRVEVVNGATP